MLNWNWDDLRFVAVLAEAGSIAEAARRLDVNRTTVQRRITAFEDQLEYKLFSRDGWGLEPLPEAAAILEAARQIGDTLTQIERKTSGASQDMSGDLRVTTTDSIHLALLGRIVRDFQAIYPAIQIQLTVSTRPLDISRREAEVAIRPSLAPPEHLVGRRICDLTFHPYASLDYLASDSFRTARQHKWIGMVDTFRGAPPEIWLANNVPGENIVLRADSFVAIAETARQGQGVAFLPSCFGDSLNDLHRVDDLVKDRVVTGLWVLTHPDFRQSRRIGAIIDFMSEQLSAARNLFDA